MTRPAEKAGRAGLAGLSLVLVPVALLSLGFAPPPVDRAWLAIWATVVGSGFAATGLVVGVRTRTSPLFQLGAALLLAAPPLAAIAPGLSDGIVTLGAAAVLPVALLRIVPAERAVRARSALEAAVALTGTVCAGATAGPWSAVAASAGLAGGVLVFCAGWLLFEVTVGDARRQVLWVVLGLSGTVVAVTLALLTIDDTSPTVPPLLAVVASVLSLALPLTAAIAVRSPRRPDVRAVISQTVVVVVMLTLTVAAFRGGLAGIELVTGRAPPPGGESLVVLALAAAFHPVLVRVRGAMDELLFGGRADPVRTLTRLGVQLSGGSSPQEWLDTLRAALAVPGIVLRHAGEQVAAAGTVHAERFEVTELRTGGEHVGELVVGRPEEQLRLSPGTRAVLELVAAPLAQALRAVRLADELQVSRGRVVTALEEERRRVRHDLHDGLGPTLTGIAYSADAAANLVQAGPDHGEQAGRILRDLRADAGEAIAEVRRIVYGLRPKALDELGLVGAVTQRVSHLRAADGRPLVVDVRAPERLPELTAAVEVAAYRVAVEAVTNVARHAGVDAARLEFAVPDGGTLRVRVDDAGRSEGAWRPGVGMASMRERVESIGGALTVLSGPDGATVTAELPLGRTG